MPSTQSIPRRSTARGCLRGLDRALAVAPTWILLLVWLFGAAATLTGRLSGEIAISGLLAGLVLITLLIVPVAYSLFDDAGKALGRLGRKLRGGKDPG